MWVESPSLRTHPWRGDGLHPSALNQLLTYDPWAPLLWHRDSVIGLKIAFLVSIVEEWEVWGRSMCLNIGWAPSTPEELGVANLALERRAGIWEAPVTPRGERKKAHALVQVAREASLSFQVLCYCL